MSVALSSSDAAVVERSVDVDPSQAPLLLPHDSDDALDVVFELPRCAAWIQSEALTAPCVQFPDELLQWAPKVATALEKATGKR